MTQHKFQVGDRVRLVRWVYAAGSVEDIMAGGEGTVIDEGTEGVVQHTKPGWVGVLFDGHELPEDPRDINWRPDSFEAVA